MAQLAGKLTMPVFLVGTDGTLLFYLTPPTFGHHTGLFPAW